MSNKSKKVVLVVGLQLVIAVFFISGVDRAYPSAYIIYQSYFADIFLPFGFYFLLTLVQDKHPVFKKWHVKALSIFTLCSTSEILQFFGIFALARVFDPLDFVMYGIGVLLAVFVDRKLFTKYLSFWD
jgi:hypothetical protein